MNEKLLMLIPLLLLVGSGVFLVSGYIQTGEWFLRSIDLKGGSEIELTVLELPDASTLEQSFSFASEVRTLNRLQGFGLVVRVGPETPTDDVIAALSDQGYPTQDVSVRTIGPELGRSFWAQAQLGLLAAFILMGIIVFAIFRTPVPSLAVILAAFSDIVITLAIMQVFGIELSLAGFAALLMLIGYSIDTDILLTTRLLKEGGEVKERITDAFKTGITMSATTIGAVGALLITGLSPVLASIALVLFIGLVVDVVITWLQNAQLLKWHIERRGF